MTDDDRLPYATPELRHVGSFRELTEFDGPGDDDAFYAGEGHATPGLS